MLNLFPSAKIYVGLPLSYGIGPSLLESMTMGAIPVQTTACCDEWFSAFGVRVTEIGVNALKAALLKGLALASNHELRDFNREIIRKTANAEDLATIARTAYD